MTRLPVKSNALDLNGIESDAYISKVDFKSCRFFQDLSLYRRLVLSWLFSTQADHILSASFLPIPLSVLAMKLETLCMIPEFSPGLAYRTLDETAVEFHAAFHLLLCLLDVLCYNIFLNSLFCVWSPLSLISLQNALLVHAQTRFHYENGSQNPRN